MAIHPDLSKAPTEPTSAKIIGYAAWQPRGAVTRLHAHDTAQLFHVVKGSLAIKTEFGTYFAPPERAVWLPSRFVHETMYLSDTEIRYLYFHEDIAHGLSRSPQVLQVTTLLRELILEFMSYPRAETVGGPAARIGDVILDQLKMLPAAPLQLPVPQEPRLKEFCEGILEAPAGIPTLAEAAAACAMSVRSFERKIRDETGMNYRTWCRQVKLFRALELLAQGLSVSEVSDTLGYEGPSAFVATFRKAFGITPGRYFSAAG